MLLTIWDAFLVHGWKALFKIGLYIIRELHDKLLESKFDDIMLILGDLPKSELMQSPESSKKLLEFLPTIKLTNTMLEQFNKEYSEEFESVKQSLGVWYSGHDSKSG